MTRFYFHAATNGTSGLPTAEQSSLTPESGKGDTQTLNRTMNTTIGSSQATITIASVNDTNAHNYYFCRFASQPIYQASIAANTWTYAFAASESNTSANFPVTANNKAVRVNCYVWRPSNSSLVGTILDGNTAATVDESTAGTQCGHVVTFSGSAVNNCQNGDVIIFEVWFVVTQGAATSYNDIIYFDGGVTITENLTTGGPNAAYIETPETLQLVSLTRVTQSNSLKYNLLKTVTSSRILRYVMQQRQIQSKIVKYGLLKQVKQARTLIDSLLARITQSRVLKYSLAQRVTLQRTLVASLYEQVTQSATLNYSLLKQVTASAILQYAVIPSGDTITHTAGDTVTWYTASNEPALTDWPGGTYTWFLKITQGNANVQLSGITLLRLNSTRTTIKASKHVDLTTTLSTAQTYSSTIDWNDDTQNPVDRSSTDTFALTIETTNLGAGTQTVVISFDTPSNTRVVTPLSGTKVILERVLHSLGLKYSLLKLITGSRILKYGLLSQITQDASLVYKLLEQVVSDKTVNFSLYKLVLSSRSILWDIVAELARIAHSLTLQYSLRKLVLQQKTAKYSLLKQLLSARTVKYNLLKQVLRSRILKYGLQQRVLSQPRIIKYDVVSLYTRILQHLTLLWKLEPSHRPTAGGVTSAYYRVAPKLKRILYPVYTPAEYRRVELRRKLREYRPLAVIEAFQQQVNSVTAPFVMTETPANTVSVRFVLTGKVAAPNGVMTFSGKAIPVVHQAGMRPKNRTRAKFVMSEKGLRASAEANNDRLARLDKLARLAKVMKVWRMFDVLRSQDSS